MGKGHDYVYLPLQNAISTINKPVDLFAVVVEFILPKKTNGPDYFCELKIMDESYQRCGISVRFFAQEMEKLPHVNSVGDIIRLHKVLMKVHNEEVVVYHSKRSSSFLLFHGKLGKDFTPYQASAPFKINDHDKVHITKMKTWWSNFHVDSGASKYSLPLQLKELNDCQHFDLICKVLHICEVSETESILFVWDGTDAPLPCLESQPDLQAGSLPLQLEQVPLSRDVLSTFPCVGTILRVFVGELMDTLVQLKVVGRWVLFHNMICKRRFGLWEGKLLPSSRIILLSDEDNIAQCHEKNYDGRLFHEEEHLPTWNFPSPAPITETELEHVGLSTLMEVLTHSKLLAGTPQESEIHPAVATDSTGKTVKENEGAGLCGFPTGNCGQMGSSFLWAYVTHKYKCVVRVIESYPSRAEDFQSPIKRLVYRIRFTLEDSTARLHAYLYGEDAVKFFYGYPDTDMLTSKMNKLLGITNGSSNVCGDVSNMRNPPWVLVGIKSYYLDKNDPWGSRHYRICDTKMVG